MKWIRTFYKTFDEIPPMFLDGCIAVGIAMLTALSLGLAQEESYKYMNATLRYWLVLVVGAVVQGLHALSKFRDGTFSRHMDAKEKRQVAADTATTLEEHPEGLKTQQTVTEQTTTTVTEKTPP